MKILFCVRHNFFESKGGAYIQIMKTKEYLMKIGVDCDLTISPYGVDYNDFDIIHLTDLTWVYDNIVYINEMKKQSFTGKKILSTIYWPLDDYASNGAPYIQKLIYRLFGINGFEFAKALYKFIVKRESVYFKGLQRSYIANQRYIVANVDWFLPNAHLEMNALNERLGLNLKNYTVANNAIDLDAFDPVIRANTKRKNANLITFVARIDARKNQLSFLKSMMETNYTILFIGNAGPNSLMYLSKLKKLAKIRGNVKFISHISQVEVFQYMLIAKVNVLTSWVETPGLVSLEAVYAGCNIVVSDKGTVREYFKNYAYYCSPSNIIDIKLKVKEAINSDFNNELKKLIVKKYSWKHTADQTFKAYKDLLNS